MAKSWNINVYLVGKKTNTMIALLTVILVVSFFLSGILSMNLFDKDNPYPSLVLFIWFFISRVILILSAVFL